VKTQAAATLLVDAMVLTISEHGGPVQAAGTVRESAHKSWARGNHSSLEDYMFEIQHRQEENVLISGTREKSAVGDSAKAKQ
jgi:hypothetical protein